MDPVNKLKSVIQNVQEVLNKGKVEIFNEEARDLINKCGRNELLAVGCKIVILPNKVEYVELPYDGLSKKRLSKLFEQLGTSAAEVHLEDMLPVD